MSEEALAGLVQATDVAITRITEPHPTTRAADGSASSVQEPPEADDWLDTEAFAETYDRFEAEDGEEVHAEALDTITDEAQGNVHLRCLRFWKRREASIEHAYQAELERIQELYLAPLEAWRDGQLKPIKRKASFHEQSLFSYLRSLPEKIRSWKGMYGTVSRRRSERFAVQDEKELEGWLREQGKGQDLARIERLTQELEGLCGQTFQNCTIKRSWSSKLLKAHVKETGELADGCDLVADDSYKADTA